MKMKFSEWFDPDNSKHMAIAVYLYEHGNWPFNTELDSIDQSDRNKWAIELAFILAKKFVDNYKKLSK